jgi:uncharacterized protein (DUF427 family)
MKAIWKNTVIAEGAKDDLIRIEGNWYFPPHTLKKEYFKESGYRTICPWKGGASYYDVIVNGERNEFGAWYYPTPKEGAIKRVGKDFSGYVAFWNGIEVGE